MFGVQPAAIQTGEKVRLEVIAAVLLGLERRNVICRQLVPNLEPRRTLNVGRTHRNLIYTIKYYTNFTAPNS